MLKTALILVFIATLQPSKAHACASTQSSKISTNQKAQLDAIIAAATQRRQKSKAAKEATGQNVPKRVGTENR